MARVDTHGRGGIRQAFYRSLVPNGFVVTVIGAAMIVVGVVAILLNGMFARGTMALQRRLE